MAEEIFRRSDEFGDGSFYRAVAYRVKPDDHFTEGVKYSFQYCDADGENILRYDNSRHSTDIPRHHKHVGDDEKVMPVKYAGDPVSHLDKFKSEMEEKR